MHFELPNLRLADAPVWDHARGMTCTDSAGTVYHDLAMVFGSRLWGHESLASLLEPTDAAPGLGDLHASVVRDRATRALCERVAAELGDEWDGGPSADDFRAVVLHTGSEAVETALKTALRATGHAGMRAFEGAYHGTFGLALTVAHRAEFREPWREQYGSTVAWTPWGEVPTLDEQTACVIVEPWQGRAGVIAPPEGFHQALRAECNRVGALLILDAVLCGSGRTGAQLASCLRESNPDIVCLGKAIGCGFAASAVVMRHAVSDAAWGADTGEALHTSTMVGDPCASIGVLHTLDRLDTRASVLTDSAAVWSDAIAEIAAARDLQHRGIGLLHALDTGRDGAGFDLAQRLLHEHRVVVVPSGTRGSSITLYPAAGHDVPDAVRDALLHAAEFR